jgi:hypothetical protein
VLRSWARIGFFGLGFYLIALVHACCCFRWIFMRLDKLPSARAAAVLDWKVLDSGPAYDYIIESRCFHVSIIASEKALLSGAATTRHLHDAKGAAPTGYYYEPGSLREKLKRQL